MSSWRNRNGKPGASYENAPRARIDGGQYEFSNRCAPCHTIGQGAKVGPDLLGVTAIRERAWLAQFIATPDKMMAEGNPIATKLLAKYKVRMPNLSLSDGDVAAIISYIEQQTAAVGAAARQDAGTKVPKLER